jgi:hypothetical protein
MYEEYTVVHSGPTWPLNYPSKVTVLPSKCQNKNGNEAIFAI